MTISFMDIPAEWLFLWVVVNGSRGGWVAAPLWMCNGGGMRKKRLFAHENAKREMFLNALPFFGKGEGMSSIGRLKDADGHISKENIVKVIPYNDHFLFVDEVV